ncbi:hypothetical protein M0R45_013932 [Rubus argutus]
MTHLIAQICHWVQTDYPKYSSSEHTEPSPHLDPEFDPDPEALNLVVKLVKHKLPWSIIIKFLAVLPVPQVAILVGFFRMRGTDFLINRKLLNVAVVLQYVPRVCQIYLTRHKFKMPGKWVKPSFNLFLYILASHVLGALWYYFAIERETSCWYKACKRTNNAGCANRAYHCGGSDITTNITLFLDQLCPINSPNSTLFDFGIFVKILQSGNTGSDKFATKFFYSLWWGLKNLSNFGTNLETSSYLWENCFAILICVIGLLLFLYLLGNAQLYIQSATQKSLDREKSRTRSIKKKKGDITNWMQKLLPDHDELRKRIKRDIREDKVVEKNLTQDVDVAYFFLKPRIRMPILEHLGVAALKKVPMLRDIMDDEDDTKLKKLCQLMEPVVYKPNSNVVRPGDPLHKMLFIIEGELKCNVPPMISIVKKNEYYGQDILEWALLNYTTRSYYDPVPSSTRFVDSGQANVEALGLDAWKLLHFIEENVDIDSPKLKALALPPRETDQMHTEDQLTLTVPWVAPDHGCVKLNCTSLWDPDSKMARLGGILRDDRGTLKGAASFCNQPCIDEFEAAAHSINKSNIEFYPQFVSSKIVVESDNELLVECLNNWAAPSKDRVRYSLQSTMENIISVASKFKSRTFVHCKRQTNAAALLLAEHADPTPGSSRTWTTADHKNHKIPEWLDSVLQTDMSHRTHQSIPQVRPHSGLFLGPPPPTTEENEGVLPLNKDMNTSSSTDPAHTTQDSGDGGNSRQDRGANLVKLFDLGLFFSWYRKR